MKAETPLFKKGNRINKQLLYISLISLCVTSFTATTTTPSLHEKSMKQANPVYLYKILSTENWEKSQPQIALVLNPNDDTFIHFAKDDEQLQRVLTKYWPTGSYVVLKIKTDKLPGTLVFEENTPGGAKYYHLYNGSVPMDAIVEHTITNRS